MSHRRGAGGGANKTSTTKNDEDVPLKGKRKIMNTPAVVTALNLETPNGDDDTSSDTEGGPMSMEEQYENEKYNLKVKHWRESPWAVGLTEVTWHDEQQKLRSKPASSTHFSWDDPEDDGVMNCLCCSAMVCQKAGRVGNMIVLKESSIFVDTEVEDEETGEIKIERTKRPRLDCVMGPYWPMLCFVTFPLIFVVSGLALVKAIPTKPLIVQFCWAVSTIGLISSLALTAFRDPGIMHRRHAVPENRANSYRWSDQAQTYRPRGAIYDPDTGVVIEGFDHTCPWTGTAIGRKNMLSFQFFVCLVFVCMVFDILLLTKSL